MTTVLEARTQRTVSSGWPAYVAAPGVLAWITVVLTLDASGTLTTQRLIGAATWVLLVAALIRESPSVRAQTIIVVAFATVVEYTFSPLLGVYVYRLSNVPAYVPPGHGLIYLAALAIGRSAFVRARLGTLTVLVLAVGGCWAAYGFLLAQRQDLLGLLWFGCLAGFLKWGPSRGLYVGAFLMVSYLELYGTSVGTWAWQRHDPTGLISIGNPPSGAAGGYGWFDLAALTLGPALLSAWTSLTRRRRRPALRPSADAAP